METFPGQKKAVELTPEELAEQARIDGFLSGSDFKIIPYDETAPAKAAEVPLGHGPTEVLHTDRTDAIDNIFKSGPEDNVTRIKKVEGDNRDGVDVSYLTKFQDTAPVTDFQISEIQTADNSNLRVGKNALTPTMSPQQRRERDEAIAKSKAKGGEKGFFAKLFGG